MALSLIIACSLAYVSLLFLIAWWVDKSAEKGVSVVNSPYIYALSLAVYCTAWTFFGSVGRATTGGLSFLGVYLGPTLLAPLWYMLLRKMILISKNQRITSIADFISSRYGKSTTLGVLVTMIAVLGIVPYISIQLKAVTFGINTLTHFRSGTAPPAPAFWLDAGFWVTVAMAVFAGFFGTRKLDPNERHEGLVAAVAFESIVKLVTFTAVGIFVTYGIFNGFGDLFQQATQREDTRRILTFESSGVTPFSWNFLMMLSLFAIILLPRQFHISVVENTSPRHIPKAMWVFPLYLLLINIFVLPVALAGKMIFDGSIHPDTYVLSLPLEKGAAWLALAAFIGGFSAATSMIVVEATALSIMFSNHIVVPTLIWTRSIGRNQLVNGAARLLDIRRISILFMLFLAYWYQKSVGSTYDLVSVGLISFTAAAQMAPVVIGAMYWKRGTHQGAVAGLLVGFMVWAYCLPLPSMAQAGIISQSFVTEGLFGLPFLKPYALFGMDGMDAITHAAFWSLLLNTWTYAIVSVNTRPTMLGLTQADLFVHIHKYISGQEYDILKREAKIGDLKIVLNRFLGETRMRSLLNEYQSANDISLDDQKNAQADLISFVETHLAGAIGAASARLVIDSVATEETITIDEVMRILDQTREAMQHSNIMEAKNRELKTLTLQLTTANEQLKQLDRLKADFITTVTHELRTPVTSIKALSRIVLEDYDRLETAKRADYLKIIADESDRISRLINQVLDIEKIRSETSLQHPEPLALDNIIQVAVAGMQQLFAERRIVCTVPEPEEGEWTVLGDRDKLIQVIVNLLSNALKFCDSADGRITIGLQRTGSFALLSVQDNGPGIPSNALDLIFEQFTQLHSHEQGKPHGTGLGLYITRKIVEQHNGSIRVESKPGEGALFEIRLPLSQI